MSRILGVDLGETRVGLAVSDPDGVIALPLEVVERGGAVGRILELAADLDLSEVVIGLPVSLSGEEGRSAIRSREFGAEVAAASGLPVHLVDERFTTRIADSALKEQGKSARARRGSIDRAAATVILQSFLDRAR
ncbi:MAG TPA: Holliday junction resolvase RuvX [Acidimicrobiia bacterium]|jgi:putative Holliday junction resolvase